MKEAITTLSWLVDGNRTRGFPLIAKILNIDKHCDFMKDFTHLYVQLS